MSGLRPTPDLTVFGFGEETVRVRLCLPVRQKDRSTVSLRSVINRVDSSLGFAPLPVVMRRRIS